MKNLIYLFIALEPFLSSTTLLVTVLKNRKFMINCQHLAWKLLMCLHMAEGRRITEHHLFTTALPTAALTYLR